MISYVTMYMIYIYREHIYIYTHNIMYVISRCTAAPRGSSSFQLLVSAVYRSMDTLMSLLLLHLCGGSRNYFSLRSLCCVAFKIDLYITYTYIYIWLFVYTCDMCFYEAVAACSIYDVCIFTSVLQLPSNMAT